MTERRTLSLGNVAARTEQRDAAERAKAWNLSPARTETIKDRARDLRRNPSPAQAVLWERIKDKQCGFGFNREVVMGSTVVDFACKTRWLVVETGGDSEAEVTLAALSDRKLTDVGVRVMRFSDADVLNDTETVVKAIKDELQKPFKRPR